MRSTVTLFILFITMLLTITVVGQKSSHYESLYSLAPSNKQNTLTKIFASLEEAGELTQQANSLYQESLAISNDASLSEESKDKRSKEIEKEALDIQLKADKMYEKANSQLFDLCMDLLSSDSETALSNDIQESRDLMDNAGEMRKKSGDIENSRQRAEMINQASEMEHTAIVNLISLLNGDSIEHSPAESELTDFGDLVMNEQQNMPSQSSVNYAAEVDEAQLALYKAYIEDPGRPDPFIYDPRVADTEDSLRIEVLRNFFTQYQNSLENEDRSTDVIAFNALGISVESAREEPPSQDEMEELTQDAALAESVGTDPGAGQMGTDTRAVESYTPPASTGDKTTAGTAHSKIIPALSATGVVYMVQIAASRRPLTRNQLQAILPGNHTIEVVFEDDWYKYRISGFRLFKDASQFARSSGVNDAWVLATDGGNPIQIRTAREMTANLESEIDGQSRGNYKDPVDYYVQVAASRLPLSNRTREELCPSGTCRMIIEEDWFKYQIYTGTSFQEAKQMLNSIDRKAFIVAYARAKKLVP